MMHRWPIYAVALGLMTMSCDQEERGRVSAPHEVSVTVSQVYRGTDARGFAARVVSLREVEIATRVSGIVRRVAVEVGDPVKTGQLLITIESGDVTANVAVAEADARLASRYHDRILALERDGAATQQELDEATARLHAAEARLRDARTQLAYVELTAPFLGVVTERHVDPGDLAVPGQPTLSLSAPDEVKIVADLPGNVADQVASGDIAAVTDPDSGNRWSVAITSVVPALDRRTSRFRIEAEFEDDLDPPPPGTYLRLEIENPEAVTAWIPGDAVVRRGQLTGVYTTEHDTLRLRWVRLGRNWDDAAELLAGLDATASVVRRPGSGLADGVPVKAVDTENWSPIARNSRVRDNPAGAVEGSR